jgi:hypothetical protein
MGIKLTKFLLAFILLITSCFREYAASQGRNQEEAVRFAQTAVWAVESVATGAAIVGIAKLVQNKATIADKIKTLKANVSSIATRAFQRTQSSKVRVDTTSLTGILDVINKSPHQAMTWGMWRDLPKEVYNGMEYAKIGTRYYSKHAIEHMSFSARDAVILSSIPGKGPVKMRRIPPMAVEETITHGISKISRDEFGKQALEHILGDIKVHTSLDKRVVISVRKETPK